MRIPSGRYRWCPRRLPASELTTPDSILPGAGILVATPTVAGSHVARRSAPCEAPTSSTALNPVAYLLDPRALFRPYGAISGAPPDPTTALRRSNASDSSATISTRRQDEAQTKPAAKLSLTAEIKIS